MDNTKSPFLSLGFWGGIGATLLGFAPTAAHLLGMDATAVSGDLAHIGTGILGAVALYGRLKATHILKF